MASTQPTTKQSAQHPLVVNQAEARAVVRYLRVAPRKVRLVADLIRGMGVAEAQAQLHYASKRAAEPVLKALHSALANAKDKKMNESALCVAEIRVDQGPILKRWIARAQGRGTPIHKKTSHITLVLKEAEKSVQSAFVIAKKKSKKELIAEQIEKEKAAKKEKKEKKVAEPEKKSEKKPAPKKETKKQEQPTAEPQSNIKESAEQQEGGTVEAVQ